MKPLYIGFIVVGILLCVGIVIGCYFSFIQKHKSTNLNEEILIATCSSKTWVEERGSYDKLMIVAHPDDESLWGGHALLSARGWHVISVTNGDSDQRRKEFFAAMEFAKVAKAEMWDFTDTIDRGNFSQILGNRLNMLMTYPYQKIVTHNVKGEYGHRQHIGIHKAVVKAIRYKNPSRLFVFGEGKILSYGDLERKRKLLSHYPSQIDAVKMFWDKATVELLEQFVMNS